MLSMARLREFGARQNMIAEDFYEDLTSGGGDSHFEITLEGLIQLALAAAETEDDPGKRVSLQVAVQFLECAIDALDSDYL